MMTRQTLLLLSIALPMFACYRLVLLNDIHLDPNYSSYCIGGMICFDLGMYKYDSPTGLLDHILQDIALNFNNSDAVLISGDFIVHGLSSNIPGQSNWPQMKSIFNTTIGKVRALIPNTPIISNVGNNDVEYHYQAPTAANKTQYYNDLYSIWFNGDDSLKSSSNSINSTFSQGGYYRYDIDQNLTVIALNSMYMNAANKEDLEQANLSLNWLEQQLENSNSDQQRFIIQMHIPPGLNYYKNVQQFWYDKYVDQYLSILNKYQSKILLVIGAHIHQADIRAPYSKNYTGLNIPLLLTPSVSPIFYNNPGYSILDLSLENGIEKVTWRFFQLYEYVIFGQKNFISFDPQSSYGISFNQPTTIRTFTDDMMNDSKLFVAYIVTKMGYRQIFKMIAELFYPIFLWVVNVNYNQQEFLCATKFYDMENYNTCIISNSSQ